jgi:hypothetical protein
LDDESSPAVCNESLDRDPLVVMKLGGAPDEQLEELVRASA